MSGVLQALFASPAASRALVDGRSGAVEIVVSGGAYVTLDDDWLLVAGPGPPQGPLTVSIRTPGQFVPLAGATVRVVGRCLLVGDIRVALERMRERRTGVVDGGGALCADAETIRAMAATIGAGLPGPPPNLREGIDVLGAGSLTAAAFLLAGVGEGLTPAGDDVLAGYAGWHAAIDDRRAFATPLAWLSQLVTERSSPLGLAYLRCAERGELPDAGADLVRALRAGSVPDARAAATRLRAWGASSGVALAWGVLAGTASMPRKNKTLVAAK